MRKNFFILIIIFLLSQVSVFAQDYEQYKYKNVVVTIKAGDSIFLVEGLLYDVTKQKKKMFYDNEISNNRKKLVTREVDKQYLIIRHKRSEFMVDADNIICIEVKKW